MPRFPDFVLRLAPRLVAAALFSVAMLFLRDCCAHWSYSALFAVMAGAIVVMVLVVVALDRLLDGGCSSPENDKGPAEPGL
jgi:hypothetical protein